MTYGDLCNAQSVENADLFLQSTVTLRTTAGDHEVTADDVVVEDGQIVIVVPAT